MTTKEEDKMFILSAITLELFGKMRKDQDYFGNYGMAHFYDMCASIANDIVDNDLEYRNYLSDKYYFHNKYTSLDWYCMDIAPSMFTEERIRRVAGLTK